MENTELLPLGTEQGREETEYSSFDLCLGESFVSPLVEQHRQWLKSIRHETPSPKIPFKVAVLSLIHISEPTRQAEISYAVFCLKKKKKK